MMKISQTAREKIREVLVNNPGKYLRVFIKGYG